MCGTLYFHALRRAFKGQWSTASLYIHQTSSNICNNVNIEAGDFSKYTDRSVIVCVHKSTITYNFIRVDRYEMCTSHFLRTFK